MPTGFVATEFAVIREDEVLVTSLGAPSAEGDEFYLMLQHKAEHSKQDVELGMHLPYIEYCGQAWSWYGHILEFSLGRRHINVQLDSEAAEHMQSDGRIEVQFNLDDADFQDLKSSLQETFAGYEYFRAEA